MRIRRVVGQGFGSFGEKFDQPFSDGLHVFYGENLDSSAADSNGAGKTTLLDAVVWAIYGRTPAGRRKDKVIAHGRDYVEVKVVLSDMWMKRTKKRGKSEQLTWAMNGEEAIHTDLAMCELELQKKIDFGFDMFCNSVFLGKTSKTVEFLTALPTKRLEVFSQMLDMSRFLTAAGLVGDDLSDLRAEVQALESYLNVLQGQEITMRKGLVETQERLSAARADAMEEKTSASAKIRALDAEERDLNESLKEVPTATMDELQKEKVKYKKLYEEAKEYHIEYKTRYTNAQEFGEGELCPTCLRELGEDDAIKASNDRENLKMLYESRYKEAVEYKELYQQLDSRQNQIRDFRQRQRLAESRIREIHLEKTVLRDSMLPPDVSRLEGLLQERRARIAENTQTATDKREELAALIPKYELGKDLKKAFSSEIRNMLLDKVRKGLEHYTNLYLSLLSDRQFKVLYPNTSKTGREKFEILLHNGRFEQDISGFSGGETAKATFAILLAIRSVLDEKNKNPFDFMFLDDPLGALDETGVQDFVAMLSKLTAEGKVAQMFVTVPRKVESGGDVTCLRIVKKSGISRII